MAAQVGTAYLCCPEASTSALHRTRAEIQGSTDFTPLWSGQNASHCISAPAAEVAHALAQGFLR